VRPPKKLLPLASSSLLINPLRGGLHSSEQRAGDEDTAHNLGYSTNIPICRTQDGAVAAAAGEPKQCNYMPFIIVTIIVRDFCQGSALSVEYCEM
jgi:hypothetical protein